MFSDAQDEAAHAALTIMRTLVPLLADAAIVGRSYGWAEVLEVVAAAAKEIKALRASTGDHTPMGDIIFECPCCPYSINRASTASERLQFGVHRIDWEGRLYCPRCRNQVLRYIPVPHTRVPFEKHSCMAEG